MFCPNNIAQLKSPVPIEMTSFQSEAGTFPHHLEVSTLALYKSNDMQGIRNLR